MILNLKAQSGEVIAKLVQTGDRESFGLLVERYEQKMKRYVRRFLFNEQEDITQEIFIKAYSNIQSFDTSRKFSPWLYRIAHNELINQIKKRGKEQVSYFDFDTVFPHLKAKETADSDILQNQDKELIGKLLPKLDPKYREPLLLYYFEDLDYKEVAEIMRIPVSTVGVRIKRAKEILKKHIIESETKYE